MALSELQKKKSQRQRISQTMNIIYAAACAYVALFTDRNPSVLNDRARRNTALCNCFNCTKVFDIRHDIHRRTVSSWVQNYPRI